MSEMFADLLAAQKEMPKLQKSAINPHFRNKYVPLEELLDAVLPILNKHNFVLLQMPVEGGLAYELRHASGESVGATMSLCAAKDDPQGQGSAITYARRYSLMALLGLTADVDDDAEQTRRQVPQKAVQAQRREAAADNGYPAPECPQGHGPMKLWPASVSKAGKPISANYKCQNKQCDNGSGWPESMWEDQWLKQVNMARGQGEPAFAGVDADADLPFE